MTFQIVLAAIAVIILVGSQIPMWLELRESRRWLEEQRLQGKKRKPNLDTTAENDE